MFEFESLAEFIGSALGKNDVVAIVCDGNYKRVECVNKRTGKAYSASTERVRRLETVDLSTVKVGYIGIGDQWLMRVIDPGDLQGLPLQVLDVEKWEALYA